MGRLARYSSTTSKVDTLTERLMKSEREWGTEWRESVVRLLLHVERKSMRVGWCWQKLHDDFPAQQERLKQVSAADKRYFLIIQVLDPTRGVH